MTLRLSRIAVPALLAASLPAAVVFAQSGTQPPADPPPAARSTGPSQEVRASLLDGRIAMIKTSLKLTPEQLKLWEPVEAQLRADFAARQQARAERRQKWAERRAQSKEERRASRLALPERLDQSSQRLTERAERLKAFADTLRPFYASLSDDQKAVANIVLRERGHRHGRRFAHRG